jgi:hypothetical protein
MNKQEGSPKFSILLGLALFFLTLCAISQEAVPTLQNEIAAGPDSPVKEGALAVATPAEAGGVLRLHFPFVVKACG